MEMKWTKPQKQVIDNRNSNLLVSAAAGSGKTAVLVEHIINRVLNQENPVDIDSMMVVTFTSAAAGEMRERILLAIEEAINKNPENIHLQKQMSYIHNAKITTLHSFCLNLIREHFDIPDIDPGFRVADNGEIELMKSDVVKEVMEEFYQTEREDFHELIEQLAQGNRDSAVENYILSFYESACSNINPEKWINDMASYYDIDKNSAEENMHLKVLTDHIDIVLEECRIIYENALKIIDEPGGPYSYREKIVSEYESVLNALDAEGFDKKCKMIAAIEFPTMRAGKDGSDKEIREIVKTLRDSSKKQIKELKELYCNADLKRYDEVIRKLKPVADVFAEVTIAFGRKFALKKREKNLVDFNDIEHMALQILTDETENGIVPSSAADEIAKGITEVIVDEYQDINQIQDTILTCLSTERFGMPDTFMVGDVKQSIYGFRKADPELFMYKYNTFSEEGEKSSENIKNKKIILDRNFRSRSDVIDSINYIFRSIMHKDFGGIEYKGENELYMGAEYPDMPEGQSGKTELLIADMPDELEKDGDDEGNYKGISKKQLEARMTASRIKELVDIKNGYKVFDRKKGEYRNAVYSDILILLRSTKSNAPIYMDELMAAGIPVYFEQQTGYFDTVEVGELLSFLNVIDNPHQDIYLAATLKSPFGGITEQELAMIRAESEEKNDLFDDAKEYVTSGTSNQLISKISMFLERLYKLREMASYTSIYDLITFIIEDTGYDSYVAAMPSGERRSANIEMLKEKALEYENGSYKGLFNFVRYIEKIKKYDIESGEASVVSENDNIVRIMSIHKSKGLEYPIVFLCNTNGKFNDMDSRKSMLIHKKYGIGMDYINRDTRIRNRGYFKDCIKLLQRREVREEEMRVLYVALTRAKEKLIITASGVKTDKYALQGGSRVSKGKLINSGSFMDFIGYVLGNDIETGSSHIVIRYVPVEHLVMEEVKKNVSFNAEEQNFRNWNREYIYSESARDEILNRISYVYPYMGAVTNYAKVSVSDLKHRMLEEESETHSLVKSNEPSEIVPEFIKQERKEQEKELLGAARGTAYHRIFELYDFDIIPEIDNINNMLENLYLSGKIDEISYKTINPEDIKKFAESELGKRMKKAAKKGRLYREAQFVMGLPGEMMYQDAGDEDVLVQGIIDVYFEEDGMLVLADYKTDRVESMDELRKRYSGQLNYYKIALEQITGMKVSEMIIYSVALAEEGKV